MKSDATFVDVLLGSDFGAFPGYQLSPDCVYIRAYNKDEKKAWILK